MDPRKVMEDVIVGSQYHGTTSMPFKDVGELFIFILLLVAIGMIGVYAFYKLWMMFTGRE